MLGEGDKLVAVPRKKKNSCSVVCASFVVWFLRGSRRIAATSDRDVISVANRNRKTFVDLQNLGRTKKVMSYEKKVTRTKTSECVSYPNPTPTKTVPPNRLCFDSLCVSAVLQICTDDDPSRDPADSSSHP